MLSSLSQVIEGNQFSIWTFLTDYDANVIQVRMNEVSVDILKMFANHVARIAILPNLENKII